MTSIERAVRLSNVGLVVTAVALAALGGVYVRALAFTPLERFQGPAQKIFYVHVPAAICALFAFGLVGVISILYLWLKDQRLDLFSASAAEVGVAFSVVMLTTGPLWGKPVWGTWWTWDARLTLTLFLFFLFVGYLLLRNAVPEPTQRARYSAVLGISGLVLIPFIHISVYLFRTLHPQPVLLKPSRPSMPGTMLVTTLMSLGVFVVLLVGFLLQRYGLALARAAREEERRA